MLTLKKEIRSSYCGGTFNFLSTNNVPRPDGPPCIVQRFKIISSAVPVEGEPEVWPVDDGVGGVAQPREGADLLGPDAAPQDLPEVEGVHVEQLSGGRAAVFTFEHVRLMRIIEYRVTQVVWHKVLLT